MKNLYIIFIIFFSACDTDEKTDVSEKGPLATPQFFFTKMTDLQVDVYAEPGAEPFSIESRRENLEGWNMVKQNLESLFERRQLTPAITVPESSTDFTSISSQNREGRDSTEIFELASKVRARDSGGTTGNFMILFLNGNFMDSDGIQLGTIGVSLTGTTVIAIFKDVIESSGVRSDGIVPKFIEQSTIVHELGHALGLVNNGVSISSEHHDADNGAHCSNDTCVMYYLNKGVESLKVFVERFKESDFEDVILFGDQCLNDTSSFLQ